MFQQGVNSKGDAYLYHFVEQEVKHKKQAVLTIDMCQAVNLKGAPTKGNALTVYSNITDYHKWSGGRIQSKARIVGQSRSSSTRTS